MLKQRTDQACVWMTAGVIRFWLCDRGFDCENCPLDRALRRACRPALPVQTDGVDSVVEVSAPPTMGASGIAGHPDPGTR